MDNQQIETFSVDPPDYVVFEITDSPGPKEAVLTLTNLSSDSKLAYKVKLSPKLRHSYAVQPSAAIVRRKTKVRFILLEAYAQQLLERHRVSGQEHDPHAKGADRFLIEILTLPPTFFDQISSNAQISASVEKEWRKISARQVKKVVLRARFVFPDSNSSSINNSSLRLHGMSEDGGDRRQTEAVAREHFQMLKKLEGQYHDVCKQYTSSVMENKKLLRQLDEKNKTIGELRLSIVEKTGLRDRFNETMSKSGLMAKAESFRRFGLFQLIIVAVSCFMLGRLLSRK